MNLFSKKQEQVEAAAAEMLRNGSNVKVLKLLTVVRADSEDYEKMTASGKITVSAITFENVLFAVFLN